MMKFIFKIFNFVFKLFFFALILLFLFSFKSQLSLSDSIAYLKTIGSQILNTNNEKNVVINSQPTQNDDVIVVNISSSNNHFYYTQLDDVSKIIYSSIEKNIDSLKKTNYSLDFSTTFNDLLNTSTGSYKLNTAFQSALDAYFYDHPEVFYLDKGSFCLSTKCISMGTLKTYMVEIKPKDNSFLHKNFNSEQEANLAIKQVENVKNNILDTIEDYNIYDKIKYVHNLLVNSIEYDSNFTNDNIYDIYGAFTAKKAVCEGYSKAFKYIMDNLGIECILVCGSTVTISDETISHMWNYVKLNSEWYGVDVTWDDPIINGGSVKNNLRYDYFLKGRNTFYMSHFSSGKISETGMYFTIPSLSSTNYKY